MSDANNPLPPVQAQLAAWAEEASILICDIFDEAKPLFTDATFPDRREGLTLWQLQCGCHTSSESTLVLVANLRLWDADVVVRSVTEGSLKFAFLLLGDAAERKTKLHEYEHVLFELSALKRSARVEEILAVMPADEDSQSLRELVLSPEHAEQIRAAYPREVRRTIEQRWSFGEICAALKRTGTPGLSHLGLMMYNFGMSSHVAHQDIVGVGMAWDRNGRSVERREAVELAHGARMISDVTVMSWIRAHFLYQRCGLNIDRLKPFMARAARLEGKTRRAHE